MISRNEVEKLVIRVAQEKSEQFERESFSVETTAEAWKIMGRTAHPTFTLFSNLYSDYGFDSENVQYFYLDLEVALERELEIRVNLDDPSNIYCNTLVEVCDEIMRQSAQTSAA